MPRKARKFKKDIEPDPKYNSKVVAKFINHIMRKGKKSIAQKIVYDAFDIINKRTNRDALDIFEKALRNTSPILETRAKRVGGANYQIPYEVKEPRRTTLAIRWIIDAARSKKGKEMKEKLAEEILSASNGEGMAVKKKNDVHRMAEANRAFAHFAR